MRLAIVIVSFNGLKWLEKSLGSCVRHAPHVAIYVVDNSSQDGSAEFISHNYSHVKLIRQEKNLGFAAGNNVGIKRALTDGAEAIFLLNQDAEIKTNTLELLSGYLEQHFKVAAVQPAILLPDSRVNSLGNCFHYLGFGYAGGYGLSLAKAKTHLSWIKNGSEPPYVSGAAVLLRAQALNEVGLFDEELFNYHEDLELSFRLRVNGWRLAVEPSAEVIHHYEFSRSIGKFYYMERNRFLVWLSYFSLPTLILLVIPWFLSEFLLLITSIFGGWFGLKLKSYSYMLRVKTWWDISKKRKIIKSLRSLSDREMLSLACSKIDFQEVSSVATRYLFNPLSFLCWKIIYPLIRW